MTRIEKDDVLKTVSGHLLFWRLPPGHILPVTYPLVIYLANIVLFWSYTRGVSDYYMTRGVSVLKF